MQLPRFVLLLVFLVPSIGQAGDWLQWRGPNHNCIAESGQSLPLEWGEQKNVIWKVEVPGRGHSSPIVVGDQIILTSADVNSQTQAVLSFDRETGRRRWLTAVLQGGFPAEIHRNNTHASPTPACDGRNVVATFYNGGAIHAICLDLTGKIRWKKAVGRFNPQQYKYGYAASPTMYEDTVIISGDCDTVAWVKALNVETGAVVWEQERPRMLNWSSPVVADVSGKPQLLISGCERMASYEPGSGKPLWSVPCLTMATCGTAVWEDGIVYASGGYPKPETVAVKADGSGEIIWTNKVKCYEQSMIASDGYIYALADAGVVYCWDAKTGETMWRSRLQGPVSSSPVLVDDKLFFASERGNFWVVRADPSAFQLLGQSKLGDHCFATPTIVDNRIYLRVAADRNGRRQEGLFCIGLR